MQRPLLPTAILALVTLSACTPAMTSGTGNTQSQVCQPISNAQVEGFFDRWNNSLKTLDPAKVSANYHTDALLLPTVSNVPRTTPESINAYFVDFLKKQPEGVINQRYIRLACNVAIDGGVYTFTFKKDGTSVTGRYTYVYEFKDGQWLIASHHSSAMPQDLKIEPWTK